MIAGTDLLSYRLRNETLTQFSKMAIPDYQTCMLHLLRLASDGAEHALKDAVPALTDIFQLTDAERTELLPSGQQAVFHNRVAWANTYLKKAELLRSPRRGVFTITDRGKSVLAKNPPKVDLKLLEQFPEFLAFKAKSKTGGEGDNSQPPPAAAIETPLESLEAAYAKIVGALKAELLDRLKAEAPAVFERVVIELLVKMGYGGSRSDAAQAIGKSGDEGLDGLIKEDRLVWTLFTCKRSDGRRRWADRRFKNSLAHYTASTRLKAFSSPRRIFREMRTNTSPRLGARSCSSTDQGWLNS
jgi:restriction endonuclease Mrr